MIVVCFPGYDCSPSQRIKLSAWTLALGGSRSINFVKRSFVRFIGPCLEYIWRTKYAILARFVSPISSPLSSQKPNSHKASTVVEYDPQTSQFSSMFSVSWRSEDPGLC